MGYLRLIREYIKWWLKARNLHGIHSPFLYEFMKNCVYRKSSKKEFLDIEKFRGCFLKKHEILEFVDPGAGSAKNPSSKLTKPSLTRKNIRDIARYSLQREKYCLLFYRMIQYFQFDSILELGTSLGITTCYMAKANPNVEIKTLEGARPVAKIALSVFEKLRINNIQLIEGAFDDVLPGIIPEKKFDMIIIDGNHRGNATLRYFSWCVKHINPEGVVVVDDIRWSEDMYNAWIEITANPDVRVTVDLFYMGLVFFNKKLSKENFNIRY